MSNIGPYRIETQYFKGVAILSVSHYTDDPHQPSLCIADCGTGEPIAVASVMLDGQQIDEDCIFIKDWSENAGIRQSLERLGLIGPLVATIPTGFCGASMHNMQGFLLDAWHKHRSNLSAKATGEQKP